ncbi:hypothetical protein DERF_015882 [Dermatophagoides farinae]|uniref:Beta-mannosidase-like galactose-binding domain-containing protein n=1 Tax=Dermatophagoides farinae TaxID=6954 RepID=A0A922HKN0_DERFA|nr:hypothetical protein DERF_015882 [Dermatophagoides farinae]
MSESTKNNDTNDTVDNQFVRYLFLVKNLLKTQQNVIQISFTSAPVYARDYFLRKEYPIPPDGETFVNTFILYRLSTTIHTGDEMSNKQVAIGFRTIDLMVNC